MKIEKTGGGPRSVGNLWLSTVAGSTSGSGGQVPDPEGCPQLQVVGRALVHGGRYVRPLALWRLFLSALLPSLRLPALLALVGLLALPSLASAATYYKWRAQLNPITSQPWFTDPLPSCRNAFPTTATVNMQDASTANCRNASGGQLGQSLRTPQSLTCTAPAVAVFQGNGTVSGTWVCQAPATCPDAVGSLRVVNVTEGWARSSDANADDLVTTSGSPPSSLDDGKCLGEVSDVKSCWRSQVPAANGLYRVSCDYVIKVAGDGSGTPATGANPLTPPPACPGFVGEVNGVTVCVGTSTQPVNGTSPSPGSESPGNPAAGPKPSTGEGSGSDGAGRTPSSGNGGNAGGPGAAATPPASPTVEIEAQCGVAGKPACSVTVDESGVPTGTNAFSTPQQALDTFALERQQGIEGAGDKTSLPWIWGFNLPSGTCAPIDLSSRFGVMEWRPCEDANINNFRAAWAYLVGIFGALYIVRSMLGAVGGSGGR